MISNRPKFASREIFEQILEYAVIPTFDLIVSFEGKGVILLRRTIAPYKDVWALPGLRMMKPEGIGDTLVRIAQQELGINIDPSERRFIGQYVGRFRTEHKRQDLSTCYAFHCNDDKLKINNNHFSGNRFVQGLNEIPSKTGAMYKFYLEQYFGKKM